MTTTTDKTQRPLLAASARFFDMAELPGFAPEDRTELAHLGRAVYREGSLKTAAWLLEWAPPFAALRLYREWCERQGISPGLAVNAERWVAAADQLIAARKY